MAGIFQIPLFRRTRCSFSLACRERQILRGLGLTALATLLLAAHLQQLGEFPSFNIPILSFSSVPSTVQKISTYTPAITNTTAPPSLLIPKAPSLPAHWSVESGSIQRSFSHSTQKAGLTKSEVASLGQIFSNQIDFRHLPQGSSFKVVTERMPAANHHAAQDVVLAASLTAHGKTTSAVRFEGKQGHTSYYQLDGSSLSPGFLRYPAHYTRIGSGFSLHRLDPVTGRYHSHPAIDFDAPMGTPITATSDGKIKTMSFEQGYGNVVRINHDGHVMTLYAHMRNFAKGLHAGSSVKKGQVIGYVGMTGYATGPHVHYELHFGAKPVNPLTTKLPSASSISSSDRSSFNSTVKQVRGLI